jgi:hypothetical protein
LGGRLDGNVGVKSIEYHNCGWPGPRLEPPQSEHRVGHQDLHPHDQREMMHGQLHGMGATHVMEWWLQMKRELNLVEESLWRC